MKTKVYNYIYNGRMLFTKVGKKCRVIMRQRNMVLLEFEDKRRDWCFPMDLKLEITEVPKNQLSLSLPN